jgi:hypothetical protein
VQPPPWQAGCACVTVVVQTLPQDPQSFALCFVSTHVPLHRVGIAAGHPELHAYAAPPDDAHTGIAPEQLVVQLPQWLWTVMSCSQPLSGFPSQSAQPCAHEAAGNEHAPAAHDAAPLTCGRFVQSFPQAPQLWLSLGTHAPPQES